MSRVENILRSKIGGTSYTEKPLSRVEELLLNLGTSGGSGGSGGGSGSGDDINGYTGAVAESQILDEADIDDIMSVISSEND